MRRYAPTQACGHSMTRRVRFSGRCGRSHMIRTSLFSMSVLFLLSAAPANTSSLRTLDFSADPNWESYRNHLLPDPPPRTKQDFGYRTTNKAGGMKAGEIGGRAQRAATPAWYAKVIPAKT